MSIIQQIRTQEEALLYYSQLKAGVLLDNAFEVCINYDSSIAVQGVGMSVFRMFAPESIVSKFTKSDKIHVVGLTIPDIGIEVGSDNLIGYISQSLKRGSLGISYVRPAKAFDDDPFIELYNKNLSDSGIPLFIPVKERPIIQLQIAADANITGSPIVIAEFIGCKFSFPKFTANLGGNSAAVFNVNVLYYDYTIKI